ncbi:acyl-CoA dehydrogenase [Amycolatopsis jejuensis]|uniref:acyl-CoA dehydrogenase n=1 Tax=Amycolatopsis jejuensis TaxID=330084 RepID=UPI000525624A|nr:acyl-CoA dehydrogenase [Amycolatopsis jejuensis]
MVDYELRRNDPALDEDEMAVREAFAEFFTKECPSSVVRAAEPLGFDSALWARLLEMGVATMSLPAAAGGDGGTMIDLVLVAGEAGRRLAPVPLASHVCATRLLAAASTPQGTRICTIAHAPAVPGVAQLVPDAAIAADVIALTGDELVLYQGEEPAAHVPNQGSTPLAWWQPGANRTTLASGPRAAALHEIACAEWKLLTAAALTGLTDGALALGVEFVKTRETMGVPVGSLQGVAYPLVDTAIEIAAARNLVYRAAWMMQHEPGVRPELPLMAFGAARSAATFGTATVVHAQGGLGFTVEADSSLYFLRAKGWSAITESATDMTRVGAQLVAGLG